MVSDLSLHNINTHSDPRIFRLNKQDLSQNAASKRPFICQVDWTSAFYSPK